MRYGRKDVVTFLSSYHRKELDKYGEKLDLNLSRLLCIALDNELQKEKPFDLDFSLPDDLLEFSYAEEATLILDYMKKTGKPITFDLLYILRHDIGIPSNDALKAGFKELINAEMIVADKVKKTPLTKIKGKLYTINEDNKKIAKEAKEYAKFQRLKKKFEKNPETRE